MYNRPRDPLAFPSGVMPRIDYKTNPLVATYPFGGDVFAAVANGYGYVDIASGRPSTPSGTPTFSIDDELGPCCSFTGTQNFAWSSMPVMTAATFSESIVSMAAIVKHTSDTANTKIIFAAGSYTADCVLYTTSAEILSGGVDGGVNLNITLIIGVPYFVIWSFFPDLSGSGRYHALVKNLRTGECVTRLSNAPVLVATTGSTWLLGGEGGSRPFNGRIAAVWFSAYRTPMGGATVSANLTYGGGLAALADDPWSLWYGPSASQKARGISAVAAVSRGGTHSLLGVG